MRDLLNRKRFITAEYTQKKNDAVTQLSNFLKDIVCKAIFGYYFYEELEEDITTFWKRVLYWEFSKEQRKGLLCSFNVNKETTAEIMEELLKPFEYKLRLDYKGFDLGCYGEKWSCVEYYLENTSDDDYDRDEVKEMWEYLDDWLWFNNTLTDDRSLKKDFIEGSQCDDVFFRDTICLLEDVEKYIEEGVIPFEPFEKFLDTPTPEQQNTREQKIKVACEMAGNDYWQRLLKAGVIKWKFSQNDNAEPFCELDNGLQKLTESRGGKNNPLLFFALCAVNSMCDFDKDRYKSLLWYVNTKTYQSEILNPQIEILFGKSMVNDMKFAYKDKNKPTCKNKLPSGSDRVINALNIKID